MTQNKLIAVMVINYVWRISGLLILLMTIGLPTAISQEPTPERAQWFLDWYTARAKVLILDERRDIRETLSPGEQRRERGIEYVVRNTNGFNAFAYREDSQDRIMITSGFVELIDWYSTAFALTAAYGAHECAMSYYDYANNIIFDNDRVGSGNRKLTAVLSPFGYLLKHRDICPPITVDEFKANNKADGLREFAIRASLRMLLAHELGHHLLNHPLTKAKSLEVHRQRETDADSFAFRKMIAEDYNPIAAIPVMILFCGIEGYSMDGEGRSDHPAALRRMLAMFTAGREQMKADPALLPSVKQKVGTTLDSADKMLRELVESGSFGSSRGTSTKNKPSGFAGAADGDQVDEVEPTTTSPTQRRGMFCGTIQGARVCQLSAPLLLGAACGCPGVPGYGVVVR